MIDYMKLVQPGIEIKRGDYLVPEEPLFFECEYYALGKWHSARTRDLAWVNQHIKEGTIRVPRLTKEQLEGMGWKYKEALDCYVKEQQYLLSVQGDSITVEKLRSGIIYKGSCTTINELLTISKLLRL